MYLHYVDGNFMVLVLACPSTIRQRNGCLELRTSGTVVEEPNAVDCFIWFLYAVLYMVHAAQE